MKAPRTQSACAILVLTWLEASPGPAAAAVGELNPDPYFSYADQARYWTHTTTIFGGGSYWTDLDSGEHPHGLSSGSLEVGTNARTGGHSSMLCVSVVGGAEYRLAAHVRAIGVPTGYPVTLELRTTSGENCSGEGLGTLHEFRVETGSPEWRSFDSGTLVTPAAARSALLLSIVRFPLGPDGGLAAQFDNVSLIGEIPSGLPERLYLGGEDSDYVFGDKLGRFSVGATWRAYDGSTGVAHPQRLTADSGNLWFFWAANVELTVKVLDACVPEFDEKFWVFIAGMTDVEVEVVVTDLSTGVTRTYTNPLGRPFETVTDHDSFPCELPSP
jgi:hypothetical protein